MRVARRVGLAAGGLSALACGALVLWLRPDSEPTVTGTVRLDNEALSSGSIAWIPVEGTAGPGGGAGIDKDGKYEIKRGLRPGKYRVEIRSTRTIHRQIRNPTIPSELVDEEVSVIPERYNTRSELFREVRPGSNVVNFDLEGATAPK